MDLRKCEFCGCNTNAHVRACCKEGRDADAQASRCKNCPTCVTEEIGCACDGAVDLEGCFSCNPKEYARPLCPPQVLIEALEKDNAELLAALPKCHNRPCENIGTKWVTRHCAYCDTHGAIYLQDTPWAAYARKKGIAGKYGNVPDQLTLKI